MRKLFYLVYFSIIVYFFRIKYGVKTENKNEKINLKLINYFIYYFKLIIIFLYKILNNLEIYNFLIIYVFFPY